MAREFNRAERVADFVKREMAMLLQQSLRDPRAANANVNDVVNLILPMFPSLPPSSQSLSGSGTNNVSGIYVPPIANKTTPALLLSPSRLTASMITTTSPAGAENKKATTKSYS